MKYTWAVPGRKVVCVDTTERDPDILGVNFVGTLDGLTKGVTYTIRSAQVSEITGAPTICLVEIIRKVLPSKLSETGYLIERFRPLHTIETDVALFAGLLTPAPNAPMLPVNINLEPTGT